MGRRERLAGCGMQNAVATITPGGLPLGPGWMAAGAGDRPGWGAANCFGGETAGAGDRLGWGALACLGASPLGGAFWRDF